MPEWEELNKKTMWMFEGVNSAGSTAKIRENNRKGTRTHSQLRDSAAWLNILNHGTMYHHGNISETTLPEYAKVC